MRELWQELLTNHRGRLAGTLFGLLSGILFLMVGFWKTLIFVLLVWLGYYFGNKLDQREDFRSFLARILPDYFKDH